jgi:hypothetical protein
MDINSVTPAVPGRGGELAWLESRLVQVHGAIGGAVLQSVRVWGTPRLVDRLQLQWDADTAVQQRWPGTEFAFVPLAAEPDGGYGWFDDRTFELDIITGDNELLNGFGLAYPGPVPVQHVETRWVLQFTDDMTGEQAEQAAGRLA